MKTEITVVNAGLKFRILLDSYQILEMRGLELRMANVLNELSSLIVHTQGRCYKMTRRDQELLLFATNPFNWPAQEKGTGFFKSANICFNFEDARGRALTLPFKFKHETKELVLQSMVGDIPYGTQEYVNYLQGSAGQITAYPFILFDDKMIDMRPSALGISAIQVRSPLHHNLIDVVKHCLASRAAGKMLREIYKNARLTFMYYNADDRVGSMESSLFNYVVFDSSYLEIDADTQRQCALTHLLMLYFLYKLRRQVRTPKYYGLSLANKDEFYLPLLKHSMHILPTSVQALFKLI